MIPKDKQLLIQDLCARLSSGVKVETVQGRYGELVGIYKHDDGSYSFDVKEADGITGIAGDVIPKPYLRPMSSMTEEEKKELNNVLEYQYYSDDSCMCESTDWLNVRHFDYRGLIEKKLALEAPDGMYNE